MLQVLNLKKGDKLAALLPISEFTDHDYLLLLTRGGMIKKQPLAQFSDVRSSVVRAIGLKVGS